MQINTGTVVDGKVVVEGMRLAEGSVVAVVSRGSNEDFRLSEAQEDELLASMDEISQGEHLSLEELLRMIALRS